MADYGFKVSNIEKDATSSDINDLLMNAKYPFAKIDQTKSDTFRTTTVFFSKSVSNMGDDTLIYRFKHGYDYEPQVWGLWDVTWGPLTPAYSAQTTGYDRVSSSTGIPSVTIWFTKDSKYINLYASIFDYYPSSVDITGTTAILTTYVFADDLSDQDYTIQTQCMI